MDIATARSVAAVSRLFGRSIETSLDSGWPTRAPYDTAGLPAETGNERARLVTVGAGNPESSGARESAYCAPPSQAATRSTSAWSAACCSRSPGRGPGKEPFYLLGVAVRLSWPLTAVAFPQMTL